MRILWIDDEIAKLRAYRNMLDNNGYEVETMSTLRDACERFWLPDFDLIILDRLMYLGPEHGGKDTVLDINAGHALFEHMRQYVRNKEVPVIIFTNCTDDKDFIANWEKDPRVTVVSKKEPPNELIKIIRKWIARFPVPPVSDDYVAHKKANSATYKLVDKNGATKPVTFRHCVPYDFDVVARHHGWDDWGGFGAVIEPIIRGRDGVLRALKLVSTGDHEDIYGFYIPAPTAAPRDALYFGSAPKYRFQHVNRSHKGVGRVCLQRYIRELMHVEDVASTFELTGKVDLESIVVTAVGQDNQKFLHTMLFTSEPDEIRYVMDGVGAEKLMQLPQP